MLFHQISCRGATGLHDAGVIGRNAPHQASASRKRLRELVLASNRTKSEQMLLKGYTKATDTEDKISESVLSCDFGKENYLACRLLAWGLEA